MGGSDSRILRRLRELHRGGGQERGEQHRHGEGISGLGRHRPSTKSGWTLGRTLLAQHAAAGQQLTGAFDFINSLGHGNYNAGFVSFTAKDWHGLTARSNFTYGRALGTGSVVQASSSITVPNPYDFNNFGTLRDAALRREVHLQPVDALPGAVASRPEGCARSHPRWVDARSAVHGPHRPTAARINDATNGEGFGEIYSGPDRPTTKTP